MANLSEMIDMTMAAGVPAGPGEGESEQGGVLAAAAAKAAAAGAPAADDNGGGDAQGSPRSITVFHGGNALTPTGSPDRTPPGSRNASFNLDKQKQQQKAAAMAAGAPATTATATATATQVFPPSRQTSVNLPHASTSSEGEKGKVTITTIPNLAPSTTATASASSADTAPTTSASKGGRAPKAGAKGTTRVTGVRGVHQMGAQHGRRFQVRVWLKRGQYRERSQSHEQMQEMGLTPGGGKKGKSGKKGKKKKAAGGAAGGGKRIHLGCFGTLDQATRAFDIAEIFFRGQKATTNLPIETYQNSPALHFLLSSVTDRTCLEEFMVVWKHIMPYRWVLDAAEPTPGVVHQFGIIREKLDRFRNKEIFNQPHHHISDEEYNLTYSGAAGGVEGASHPLSGGIAKYLQTVVNEKRSRDHQPHQQHQYHQQMMAAAGNDDSQRKQLSDLLSIQIANVVGGQPGAPGAGGRDPEAVATFQHSMPEASINPSPLHFGPRGNSFGDLGAAMAGGGGAVPSGGNGQGGPHQLPQRGWLTSSSDCIDTLYSQVSAALAQGLQGLPTSGPPTNPPAPNANEFNPLYYS